MYTLAKNIYYKCLDLHQMYQSTELNDSQVSCSFKKLQFDIPDKSEEIEIKILQK